MKSKNSYKDLHPVIGLVWCVAVLGAYYTFNVPYYMYKVSVFSEFLLDMLR